MRWRSQRGSPLAHLRGQDFLPHAQTVFNKSLRLNLGKDYEIPAMKLELLNSRVKAWGESLAVTHTGRENTMLRSGWAQEKKTVGRCLIGIKGILEDTKRLESRYGLRLNPQSPGALSTTHLGTSMSLDILEQSIRTRIRQRQSTSTMLNQAR